MTNPRTGVTVLGMVGAGGAGVFLGALPGGLIALFASAFTQPQRLTSVPVYVLFGALVGVAAAYVTRHSLKPQRQHRYRLGAIAGAITVPLWLFIGVYPEIFGDQAAQWPVGFALLCGGSGLVVYYRWRTRLTQQLRARRAEAFAEQHHSTAAH